jgi:choline-sulfatase
MQCKLKSARPVSLRARACRGKAFFEGPRASVYVALAVLLAAALLGSSCAKTDSRPNVLFIIIDTLRADHLGCYGAQTDATPNMDALASAGARFSQCVTAVPVTLPSISSILTSSYPIYHGVRDNGTFTLDESLTTMAEVFHDAGYATAGVVGAYILTDGTGIEQGFDHYDCQFSGDYKLQSSLLASRAQEVSETQRRAEEVTQRACAWLKAKHKPFFLMVHYFDPHAPYDPPSEYGKRYSSSVYLGEIAYTDAQLGPLIEEAQQAAAGAGLITALIADHGEGLGQHNEKEHGFFIYDSTLHVPFIVDYPGRIPGGQVVTEQVRTIDLGPTVLDLAGIAVPESWQGLSLADGLTAQAGGASAQAQNQAPGGGGHSADLSPSVRAEGSRGLAQDPDHPAGGAASAGPALGERDSRVCYIETYRTRYSYNWSELVGIRYDGWKLIRAPMPELYDLADDPQEEKNLYEEDGERVHVMESILDDALARWSGPFKDRGPTVELDESGLKKLEALGYVMPHKQLPTGPLPDPKVKIEEFNRRFASRNLQKVGQTLLEQGNLNAAERKFTEAIELDPANAEAIHGQGFVLWSRGDRARALELFEKAVTLNPASAGARRTLGNVYMIMGRSDEASDELQAAITLDPTSSEIRLDYGMILEEKGDLERALEQYRKAVELDPGLTAAQFQAALLLLKLHRVDEAKAMLQQLLAREPSGERAESAMKLLRELDK